MKTSTVALALTSALGAVAAPAPQPIAEIEHAVNGHFAVTAQRNANFVRNGPSALLKAYAKYKVQPPKYLVKAVSRQVLKRQDGTVPAKDQPQDVEYLCDVKVGDQTLALDFDTGSSDLWVMSDLMTSSSSGKGGSKAATADHTNYKCSAKVGGGSKSRVRRAAYDDGIFWRRDNGSANPFDGSTWQISYGDGSNASGKVAADTVSVGGVAVDQQAVECAVKASDQFQKSPGDGLLGLAFSSINTVKPKPVKTWFDNAVEQKKIAKPAFVVDLQHNKDGSYTFGKTLDESKGAVKSTKVDNSQGFWQFTADKGFTINGKHYDDKAPNGAIADTGTTLLLMGDNVASTYYKLVDGAKMDQSQGGWTFPCDAKLPDIDINIGDSFATVPGSLINFAPISEGSKTCFGGLQGMGGVGGGDGGDGSDGGDSGFFKRQDGGIPYIYGDVFLKAFLAEFNNEGPAFKWQSKTVA